MSREFYDVTVAREDDSTYIEIVRAFSEEDAIRLATDIISVRHRALKGIPWQRKGRQYMSAAEFIINNKIDLFTEKRKVVSKNGNILVETSDYWVFMGSDGHLERVYL